jgi:hypothetical protein
MPDFLPGDEAMTRRQQARFVKVGQKEVRSRNGSEIKKSQNEFNGTNSTREEDRMGKGSDNLNLVTNL